MEWGVELRGGVGWDGMEWCGELRDGGECICLVSGWRYVDGLPSHWG